ncbi:Crp/Fnr family transcriptional regulator [Halarcobacter bivalviorum]|uniref:Crp/Fnr family transcriptional regulator n=1 Tax=Halarcobacter bivalviorum TaxID=663364 RepID=UPI00100C0AFB|nr:Crp/Fnr family transcriptional regulator [Halarcobacter bivalviorum]RXK06638.1 transcriptional regulator [Halarcobacter bivalviorum]
MISSKEIFKNISLFSHLNDSEIDSLIEISSISKYDKNSILYYETEDMDKLLFLIEGQIKVYKIDKYDNEIFLYYIYSNSMISELSNLNENKIQCFSNAEFVEDSVILSIDYQKFKEMFLFENAFILKFIEELIYKNQQLQCIVNRELVFDATSKVAFMLINDLKMFNQLKRTEVSLLLHIQPETLSRVLKKLNRSEIISIDRGKISINNYDELKSIYLGM